MKIVGIFLVAVALIAGVVGFAPAQYDLTISSIEGGEAEVENIPETEIAYS